MSNYPPGVNGSEYAIAGPDREWDDEAECGNDGVTLTVLAKGDEKALDTILALAEKATETTDHAEVASLLRNVGLLARQIKRGLIEAEDMPCPFVGEVTWASYGSDAWWDCPLCGDQHTEERINEPDPDDERDRLLDR